MLEIVILLVIVAAGLFFYRQKNSRNKVASGPTPEKWKKILLDKVHFYRNLNPEQRLQFESDITQFLGHVKITGVQTDVDIEDRLLVASSAVIPLFGYPAWTYKHLDEVLLYPASFDRNFNIGSKEEIITGMVGNGPMEGKVILSKPALHTGFDISADKKNVGIHEFVHLFDKETGAVDGVPPGFEDRTYVLPWLEFVNEKINDIIERRSDIDGYATTNRQEFFAVASEYFFERPNLLKKKHPKLYNQMATIFNQDLTMVSTPASFTKKQTIGRNDPCPCGSGKKYKKCCLG